MRGTRRRNIWRALGFGLVAAWLAASTPARAQDDEGPSDEDRAAAQVLFDEGRELMKGDQVAKACDKFAESMRLDRAIGTQLNLAACYEKLGRYASAWINFEEARARAVKAGQDNRVAIASERAEALEPRLSRLEILVPNPPEGLVVERDGVEVGAGQWGVALPIDGGPHAIVARAPGKKPWKTTVEAKPENDRVEVSIPELEDAPPEPEPIVPPTPAPADDTGLVAGAIVAGSLGVIGVGLGAAFGVLAMGKDSASLDHCPEPPNGCTAEGVDLRNQAFTFAHVSTTGFVVGGVGLAVGAVLLGVALSGDDEGGSDDDDGAALEAAWLPYVDLDGGGGVTARLSW